MGFSIIKPPRKDTFIKERSIGCKCFSPSLPVGRIGGKVFRSLIEFSPLRLPPGLKITNATLNLYLTSNTASKSPNTIEIYQLLSEWPEKCVSFKHQPLFKTTPASTTDITSQHTNPIVFGLTALVENWYNGTEANLGILLKAANEGKPAEIVFASKEFPNSKFWPYLKIEYLDPAQPDKPGPPPLDVKLKVTTYNALDFTPSMNTLMFNYTYIVTNTGSAPALAYFESSPDSHHWDSDITKTINPGEQECFVPTYITKYSRLCYKSEHIDQSTHLIIYIQGHL